MIAFALGLALGVVTGMPLGVVNVAVAEAAVAGRARFAIGIGIGGAIADSIHAGLAFVGVGRTIASHPEWTRAMAIVAGVVVVGYAALAWRARRAPVESGTHRGIPTGLLLTLPNPAALGAWIAVAGAVWPGISVGGGLAVAAGVGVGSAVWFTAFARWIAAHRDRRAARLVPRVAVVLLVAIAVVSVARVI